MAAQERILYTHAEYFALEEKYDRGDKFQAYWTLETFKEYVLIDQYRLQIEYFRRMDEKLWQLQILTTLEEQLTLRSIGVTIPLNQIYRNVTWDE